MLQRAFGFEQRRDIDLVGDPEQVREIERGEHRGRLLALGHQHPDRRIGVHMGKDLRHRQELPVAVLASIASAPKLLRRGFSSAIARRRCTTAPLLARSRLPSGSMRRRMALWSCLAFTRKWIQPMPSPSARIAAARVLRATARGPSSLACRFGFQRSN